MTLQLAIRAAMADFLFNLENRDEGGSLTPTNPAIVRDDTEYSFTSSLHPCDAVIWDLQEGLGAWEPKPGDDLDALSAGAAEMIRDEMPSIRACSEEIASTGTGDAKLTLFRVTSTNALDWAIGLEWIETNGDPVTENEEGFRDLRDKITGDDELFDLLREGVEISLSKLENVTNCIRTYYREDI